MNNAEKLSEKEVSLLNKILTDYGISSKYIGRYYIKEVVEYLYFNRSLIRSLNSHVYPVIAEKNSTNPGNIEKSIRNALLKSDYHKKHFDITNKELLWQIVEEIESNNKRVI